MTYTTKLSNFTPIKDHVVVSDMHFAERITAGGIVIPNDDMKNAGIRPRWARVYAIGPEQKDVQVGQYILITHGRWTRGLTIEDAEGSKVIRRVDPNDIIAVSDEPMQDETMGNKVI